MLHYCYFSVNYNRLADANGLTLDQFTNAFIFPQHNLKKNQHLSPDSLFDSHIFFKNLNIVPDNFIDMMKKHTILPFILLNQTKAFQIETILSVFDYYQIENYFFEMLDMAERKYLFS